MDSLHIPQPEGASISVILPGIKNLHVKKAVLLLIETCNTVTFWYTCDYKVLGYGTLGIVSQHHGLFLKNS